MYRSIFGRECPFFDDEYDKQDDEESDEEPVQVPSNQPRPNRDVVVKSREIYVKLVNGKTVAMDLNHFEPSDTIEKLLHKIAAEQGSPPNQLRLYFKGRQLELGGRTLTDYNIWSNAEIHVRLRLRGC